jgi:hypothetical protein
MDKLWITIIVLLIIVLWQSWLLFKKPTTSYEIDHLKQKNKKNEGSIIDNQINAQIESNKPKKEGILQRLKHKRKLKKENK